MEPARRHAPVPLSETLRGQPEGFELLQALLILEHEDRKATSLGCGSVPQHEAVRLRGPLTPVFPTSQVEKLSQDAVDPRPILTTPVFGLGGPDGPLPYAFQEWLQQRALARDHAPAEFLNLFQHRLYLEKFSADKGLKLSPVINVPTAGLGIYSNKIKSNRVNH